MKIKCSLLSYTIYKNTVGITLQMVSGWTWDPSSQTHIGPFEPEVQI